MTKEVQYLHEWRPRLLLRCSLTPGKELALVTQPLSAAVCDFWGSQAFLLVNASQRLTARRTGDLGTRLVVSPRGDSDSDKPEIIHSFTHSFT